MTKNDLMSLLESNSPLNHTALTPLEQLILLCASFEAGLIHSFIRSVNFNRHNSCEHHEIKCHDTPQQKEVESLAKVTQNMLA